MKKEKITMVDLIRQLPMTEMIKDAKELGVDYKSKKLNAISLTAIILQGFLMTSRLSQRYLGNDARLISLSELYGVRIHEGAVSHSSISERLSKIDPKFFEDTYAMLYDRSAELFPIMELYDDSLIRADTTLVAETANKLKEGIQTGVNDRYGGDRKQIKYGMAFDGFGVLLAKVFTKQSDSGEEIPLGNTVKDAISESKGKKHIYLFDRGISSVNSFKDIAKKTVPDGSKFVSRLKINRKIHVLTNRSLENKETEDGNIRVVADFTGNLRKSKSTEWDPTEFRFIKVEFVKPRPKSASASSHRRKYDPFMILVTNDMDTDPLTIAQYYLRRWDIEVFFRFLKQNLTFSHFISTSINGIKVILYMTLIMALLIKLYGYYNQLGPKMALANMQVDLANWLYLHPVNSGLECASPNNQINTV